MYVLEYKNSDQNCTVRRSFLIKMSKSLICYVLISWRISVSFACQTNIEKIAEISAFELIQLKVFQLECLDRQINNKACNDNNMKDK